MHLSSALLGALFSATLSRYIGTPTPLLLGLLLSALLFFWLLGI